MNSVTLNFLPSPNPGVVALHIYESPLDVGPWTEIEVTYSVGVFPAYISTYTTNNAVDVTDWFAVAWEDATGVGPYSDIQQPNQYSVPVMCSVDDINGWLDAAAVGPDKAVVTATVENTTLIQIDVNRIIRGYLARVFDTVTLYGWNTPDNTPEIIRAISSMLTASQLYIDKVSGQEFSVDDRHYAQILYDRAMLLLQGIVDGSVIVVDDTGGQIPQATPEGLTTLDFFPVDDTDRAFTMSLRLD